MLHECMAVLCVSHLHSGGRPLTGTNPCGREAGGLSPADCPRAHLQPCWPQHWHLVGLVAHPALSRTAEFIPACWWLLQCQKLWRNNNPLTSLRMQSCWYLPNTREQAAWPTLPAPPRQLGKCLVGSWSWSKQLAAAKDWCSMRQNRF